MVTRALLTEPDDQTTGHYGNRLGKPPIDEEVMGQNKDHVCRYLDAALSTVMGCVRAAIFNFITAHIN